MTKFCGPSIPVERWVFLSIYLAFPQFFSEQPVRPPTVAFANVIGILSLRGLCFQYHQLVVHNLITLFTHRPVAKRARKKNSWQTCWYSYNGPESKAFCPEWCKTAEKYIIYLPHGKTDDTLFNFPAQQTQHTHNPIWHDTACSSCPTV